VGLLLLPASHGSYFLSADKSCIGQTMIKMIKEDKVKWKDLINLQEIKCNASLEYK